LQRRHPGRDRLMAAGVGEDPLQLCEIADDEVDQRRSRSAPNLAPQCVDRCPAVLDEVGDDRRVGLDLGRWRS